MYSRVVQPVPLTRETTIFLPHTTDDLMKSFTFKELSPIKCNTYKNLDKTTLFVKTLAITNASNKFQWMMIFSRYMKFIYFHCGEEMKLRDPRS